MFTLLRRHLLTQTQRCVDRSVRINVIGRRDRLPPGLCREIERSEQATAHCNRMHLRIAVDYSSQHSLLEACRRLQSEPGIDRARFAERLADVDHALAPAPEVDLLIRTGGEQRLSDFLLWECAFAEFVFLQKRWPEFVPEDLEAAVKEFHRRERTRGGLPKEAVS